MILFSQNFLCGILDKVFQAGFDNNQASVKYFIEWTVILSLHKYPQFLNKFWDCFCYVSKNFCIHLKSNLKKVYSLSSHTFFFDIFRFSITFCNVLRAEGSWHSESGLSLQSPIKEPPGTRGCPAFQVWEMTQITRDFHTQALFSA